MAQYGYTDIHLGLVLNVLADIYTAAYALGYNNQGIAAAILVRLNQVLAYLIQIELTLRNQYNLGTAGNACQGSQPATAAAHNLYYSNAAVSRSSITELVDSIDNGVGSSIAADGVVSTPYIIINGTRQAYDRHTSLVAELGSTTETAVAADDNQTLNAVLFHVLISLHTALWSHETLAAGSTQEGTATLENIGNAARSKLLQVLVQQATISIIDTEYLATFIQYGTNYGTGCCIHARAVATAS